MPEWDDLLAHARAKRDARTEELRRLEAAQLATADDPRHVEPKQKATMCALLRFSSANSTPQTTP